MVSKDRDKNTSTQEKQPLCKSSCQMTWYLLPCDAIFKPTFSRQMDAAYKMYIHCSTQNGKDALIAASRSSCPCLVQSGWKEGGLLPFLSCLSIEDTKAHHPTRTLYMCQHANYFYQCDCLEINPLNSFMRRCNHCGNTAMVAFLHVHVWDRMG